LAAGVNSTPMADIREFDPDDKLAADATLKTTDGGR
jgi:hypothetical protein